MPDRRSVLRPCAGVLLAAVALGLLGGCGSRKYPVTGKVVFKDDGSPLPGGVVVFSPADPANLVGARGYVELDGTFELSTDRPGDGSLAGRYQVLVRGPSPGGGEDNPLRNRPLIDPKYSSFETSGIELEVKPGKNHFTIEVERPPGARRTP
jgi:hypothetical protein